MLSFSRWTALVFVAAGGLGCAQSFEVRTMVAPEIGPIAFMSFRMLPGPARRDGRPVLGSDDPMISNSIANRALRDRIVRAFQDRGYTMDEQHADFAVAFYATAKDKLDIASWDYGYPGQPGWGRIGQPAVVQYTEGSVVIDIVSPSSSRLWWRGEGRAILTDDPGENIKQLAKVAESIVKEFPPAKIRAVAVRP